MKQGSDWFRRFLLPGFAFKAVVIGGGYATGRELATFFLPSGPRGGLCGMLLAAAVWSLVCVLTFVFAARAAATTAPSSAPCSARSGSCSSWHTSSR